jgi:hypothetical protein
MKHREVKGKTNYIPVTFTSFRSIAPPLGDESSSSVESIDGFTFSF